MEWFPLGEGEQSEEGASVVSIILGFETKNFDAALPGLLLYCQDILLFLLI